jgi:hypothetical protein
MDALSLSKATMAKVHQNLAWAVAYNIVAIPIAAGVLLPQFDFAMTPSLSGTIYRYCMHLHHFSIRMVCLHPTIILKL